ncbi:MAG: hypothetical protein ACTSWR_02100 [Candidatus Helarchaeota archaeon]
MVVNNELDELENLIKNNNLEEAFELVKDLFDKQTEEIIATPEGNARAEAYYKLKDRICDYQTIPIFENKHYVKKISMPLGIIGAVGIGLVGISFISLLELFFLAIIGLIMFAVGLIGFVISLPICIAINMTSNIRRPESWIVKIGKQKGRIDLMRSTYSEYQIKRLELDLLKYYWYWIISIKKFGYIVPDNVEL